MRRIPRGGALLPVIALASALLAGLGCARSSRGPVAASVDRTTGAPERSADVSCRVTGEAQVVASNVLADEVQVRAEESGFRVIVLDAVDPCLTVDVSPEGRPEFGGVLAHCPDASPLGEAVAINGVGEQYFAHEIWDDSGARHLAVGVDIWDVDLGSLHSSGGALGFAHKARQVPVEHPFVAPPLAPSGAPGDDEQAEPKLSASARGTFLLVWVEADAIRAQPIGGWAVPVGAPLVVSPEGATEVEHPAVALTPTGRDGAAGLVVYAARTSFGFHVFATPVACSAR